MLRVARPSAAPHLAPPLIPGECGGALTKIGYRRVSKSQEGLATRENPGTIETLKVGDAVSHL